MKPSFILGILGGIFAILVALFEFVLGVINAALTESFGSVAGAGSNTTQLYTLGGVTMVAGIIGIVGAAIGKKLGGALMIIAGVLALIGSSLFGVLPFILLLVGGILALREKVAVPTAPVPPGTP